MYWRIFRRYATYLSVLALAYNALTKGASFQKVRLSWWQIVVGYYAVAGFAALVWGLFDPATVTRKRWTLQTTIVVVPVLTALSLTLYPVWDLPGGRWPVIVVGSVFLGVFYGHILWPMRLVSRRGLDTPGSIDYDRFRR